jgi:hypothetical protein
MKLDHESWCRQHFTHGHLIWTKLGNRCKNVLSHYEFCENRCSVSYTLFGAQINSYPDFQFISDFGEIPWMGTPHDVIQDVISWKSAQEIPYSL